MRRPTKKDIKHLNKEQLVRLAVLSAEKPVSLFSIFGGDVEKALNCLSYSTIYSLEGDDFLVFNAHLKAISYEIQDYVDNVSEECAARAVQRAFLAAMTVNNHHKALENTAMSISFACKAFTTAMQEEHIKLQWGFIKQAEKW